MCKKPLVCLISVSLVLGGCATATKDIATSSVSPLIYQSYDCSQISAEALRIQGRITELGGRLDQAAENDKAITAAGILLFWPALFFLGGTKQQEAEYGRLRGEYEALQQAAIEKKCPAAVQQTAGSQAGIAAAAVSDQHPTGPDVQVAVAASRAQQPIQVGAPIGLPDIRMGDQWKYQVTDGFSSQRGVAAMEVIRVDANRIHTQSAFSTSTDRNVSASAGGKSEVWDRNWNLIRDGSIEYSPSYPFLRFPLNVGSSWRGKVKFIDGANLETTHDVTAQVVGWERVVVPAGSFDVVRIQLRGGRQVSGGGFLAGTGTIDDTYWYSPAIRQFVKKELHHGASGSVYGSSVDAAAISQRKERWELLEFKSN